MAEKSVFGAFQIWNTVKRDFSNQKKWIMDAIKFSDKALSVFPMAFYFSAVNSFTERIVASEAWSPSDINNVGPTLCRMQCGAFVYGGWRKSEVRSGGWGRCGGCWRRCRRVRWRGANVGRSTTRCRHRGYWCPTRGWPITYRTPSLWGPNHYLIAPIPWRLRQNVSDAQLDSRPHGTSTTIQTSILNITTIQSFITI